MRFRALVVTQVQIDSRQIHFDAVESHRIVQPAEKLLRLLQIGNGRQIITFVLMAARDRRQCIDPTRHILAGDGKRQALPRELPSRPRIAVERIKHCQQVHRSGL
jgi:hypothetical protein